MMILNLFLASALAKLEEPMNHVQTRMTVQVDSRGHRRCQEIRWSPRQRGKAMASGSYWNKMHDNGWDELQVKTIGGGSAELHAFAAGCVEARLTHKRIYQYWANYVDNEYDRRVPSEIAVFMKQQEVWLRQKLVTETGPFWENLRLVMAQFDGLVQGVQQYAMAQEKVTLTPSVLYMLNSIGDLETVNEMFTGEKRRLGRDYDMLDSTALIFTQFDTDGLLEDVYLGHATWRSYYAMLRIWKVYDLHYMTQGALTFSSSPGLIHSKDDFYVTKKLIVMETTNDVSNPALTEWLFNNTTSSVLSWQRAMVATGWATDGRSWTELFSQYNSGTYNNQWMVFDTTKIVFPPTRRAEVDPAEPTTRAEEEVEKPAEEPTVGALSSFDMLWLAEQIPGQVETGDVSSMLLSQGYWPSYNVPYFQNIYDLSGYPVDRNGINGYDGNARAQIFARETMWVQSLGDFQDLMRYNRFQFDPICKNLGQSGSCGISSRMDLAYDAVPFGGIDAKVVSVLELKDPRVRVPRTYAQAGPTRDDQTDFYWTAFPFVAHRGLGEKMAFSWTNFPTNTQFNHTY